MGSEASILTRLRQHLPAHRILTDEDECRLYDCDGLTLHRGMTPAVLLIENENEVI